MALPSSGQISISQVGVELGRGWNWQLDLNYVEVRTLFNKPSGQIAMSDGHGKSNLSVTVNTSTVSGSCSSSGGCIAVTGGVTCSVSNGSGNYAYLWEKVSGAGTIDSANAATTAFRSTVDCKVTDTGVFRCRVTDNVSGTIKYSPNVTASFINNYGGTCL